jgi:hypothetical protein
LPSSGHCLQSHYLATGLHAEYFQKLILNSDKTEAEEEESEQQQEQTDLLGCLTKMVESRSNEKRGAYSMVGVTRNEYKIVVGNLRDIHLFGELSIGGKILLKRILKEDFSRVWNRLIYFRKVYAGDLL